MSWEKKKALRNFAHLFLLFPTQMFCKDKKHTDINIIVGACWAADCSRSISFSHLHCLQPGSPAVKLFFCLLPDDSSFCLSFLHLLFHLGTLAKTCLCCGAEGEQIIWFNSPQWCWSLCHSLKLYKIKLICFNDLCTACLTSVPSSSLHFKENH